MSWFGNLRIASKLLIGFMIVAVVAAAIGIAGMINLREIENQSNELYRKNVLGLQYAADACMQFQNIRVSAVKIMLDIDKDTRSGFLQEITECVSDVEIKLKNYENTIKTQEDRELFNEVKSLWEKYRYIVQRGVGLVQLGNLEEAQELILADSTSDVDSALNGKFSQLFEYNVSTAKEKAQENKNNANTALIITFIVMIIGVIIAISLGFFISRSISKPVIKLEEAAEQIALGNIDVKIEVNSNKSKNEIEKLKRAFSNMADNIREQVHAVEKMAEGDMTVQVKVRSENDLMGKKLTELININNEVLGNINSAAEQVASGARQVSDSSQILSHGSAEQASSIEEVTESMSQIAEQTKQNALNAVQANEIALKAKENAEAGNSQMQEMIKAMEEINDSSNNISKIIKVIDEIAFQTNILALNAAVEAARAGQHGKGFAVVADEVRNVAARSADAAKETTELIENSIKKVEVGNKIASDTAYALNEIVEGITKAADLVGEIAEASNDQASAIAQINQAISQVAEIVQNNSATAEESAAASEELSAQAELLKDSVSRFKLKKVEENFGVEELNDETLKLIEEIIESKRLNRNIEQESESNSEESAEVGSTPENIITADDDNSEMY